MTDGEVSMETAGTGPVPAAERAEEHAEEHGPLVAVTFQKDPLRKHKYLESEPKALGLTQIALSVFQISSWAFLYSTGIERGLEAIPQIAGSVLVIVAGILALAAQSLHLPTLKACLGMQLLACVVSFLLLFLLVVADQGHAPVSYMCWHTEDYFNVTHGKNICAAFMDAFTHFNAERIVLGVVTAAISATLVAYCCKVITCCSPSSRMPVITVQAPPAQLRDATATTSEPS